VEVKGSHSGRFWSALKSVRGVFMCFMRQQGCSWVACGVTAGYAKVVRPHQTTVNSKEQAKADGKKEIK